MRRRAIFDNKGLPYLLLLPQLVIVGIFFYWPAVQSISLSLLRQTAFGFGVRFAGLQNFLELLHDPYYLFSFRTTILFSVAVVAVAMSLGLLLAVMADSPIRGTGVYKTLLMWPYAIAPAVAAALWLFLFHPSIGIIGRMLNAYGIRWDYMLNGSHALLLVILAAAWKQVSYNFIFFLAGLQSIPKSLLEAAEVDGAGAMQRFWRILFPLLSPTTFFLLAVNMIFAFFETFGVIHALTKGGPAKATETLVYKVYVDGVINLDLGRSSAQSVILLIIVGIGTMIQFRYLERRVYYL